MQQRRAAQAALEALAAYLATRNAAGAVRLASEKQFELDVEPARLRGTIDRIEQQGDDVIIIDLKTGRPRSQGDIDASPQLKAYQLAFSRGEIAGVPADAASGGARMLYTRSTTKGTPYKIVDQTPLSDEQRAEFTEFLRVAARTMAGTEFPATVVDDPYALAGAETRIVHLPGEVSGD